jgi:adenylate cyclase
MIQSRRLAAILAADVAGYSRLIGADEEGTLNRLRSIRADIIDLLWQGCVNRFFKLVEQGQGFRVGKR